MSLQGKTLLITGASRGIGHAIGLRAAQEGANIVVLAKTTEPHPKLPGTIFTAAQEMEDAGGAALALACDIRFEEQVQAAVDQAVQTFGGIDICVNNASAISLTDTASTTMKRWDLMHQVNTRGTFLVSKLCLPHLLKSSNAHILNLGPPLNLDPHWFENHTAYTISKYGMSLCTLGMAAEFGSQNIAVNSLWPKTSIATAAVNNLLGGDLMMRQSRKPTIVADAAIAIFKRAAATCTGNFFVDEDVLRAEGVTDFTDYAVDPTQPLMPDFFL